MRRVSEPSSLYLRDWFFAPSEYRFSLFGAKKCVSSWSVSDQKRFAGAFAGRSIL
jgi:hypothetical protein